MISRHALYPQLLRKFNNNRNVFFSQAAATKEVLGASPDLVRINEAPGCLREPEECITKDMCMHLTTIRRAYLRFCSSFIN